MKLATVKIRAADTMSERQLVLALAAGGRKIALADLTVWRQDGLLPPLASSGIHNGRSYYWREPDILDQAQAAFDELHRHGRTDAAMIALWLGGFEVPLPRLRRAWMHAHKLANAATIRRAIPVMTRPRYSLCGLLQQAVTGAITALHPEDTSRAGLAMLEHAAAWLGLERSNTGELHQVWHMAQVTVSMLSASDLLRQASDDVLQRARRAQRLAMDFICQSGAAESRMMAVAALGRPMFLYILTLLVSGQEPQLETALARIRQHRKPAPRPLPAYAQT